MSKPVRAFVEIKNEAIDLIKFIASYNSPGLYNKVYALAHAEVSQTPYSFFVVSPEVVKEQLFPAQIIINPEILEMPIYVQKGALEIENIKEVAEPCVSFAFRQPKKVNRYNSIKVRFATLNWRSKLVYQVRTLTGVASAMYQHLLEHINGQSPYYYNPSPVKWWELIGSAKSVGGCSLDTDSTPPPPRARMVEK
jgi:peptide deformylase